MQQDGYSIVVGSPRIAEGSNGPDLVLIIVGLGLIYLSIGYFAVSWLFKPIRAIRAGAAHIGRGNFEHRIRNIRRDQLGDLAGDINALAGDVQHMLDAKRALLLGISHELRTPLNGIIGFADLLQHEKLEKKETHYISQISKAGKTLQRIVNDILDITAIEAGEIRLYDEPFSLRGEINDLITLMSPMAERKELTLKFNIDESIKDNLTGDISRLRQIIGNLISNAVKYTETGHVALNIIHLGSSNGKEMLRFEVKDTGIGINEEAL
jgi:signal transduction histidine kinase